MSDPFSTRAIHLFRAVLPVSLLALAPLLAAAPAAASDEKVFEGARQYTVKVRTRVELPFIGDRKGTRIGAGFVVDAERGWLLTNAHVASRSPSRIQISFHRGSYLAANKLYVDPYLDLAVLEITGDKRPKKITAAPLACSADAAIGHPVGAFGHPWDLSFTGTRGIISGVTSKYTGMLEMLQTDAPINPGNSGGPLISLKTGKVLGINTASRRSSQNTNFAVPMRHACRVIDLLRAGKDPSPPDLPWSFVDDLDDSNELVVARIYDDENGAPGVREGDVIQGVEGVEEEIENRGALLHALRGRLNKVTLRVRRGEKEVSVRGRFRAEPPTSEIKGVYSAGVLFARSPWRDLNELSGGKLTLMVHFVERGSSGDAQRVEKLDLLYSVDGKRVEKLAELNKILSAAHADKRKLRLKLVRVGDMEENLVHYVERELTPTEPKVIDWK